MRRLLVVSTLVLACAQADSVDPIDPQGPTAVLDDRRVHVNRPAPPPISGGTLVLAPNGVAIATDPDRDLVHVVDVAAKVERFAIALLPGDEPGRATIDGEGLAHVVLRGAGAIATIDPTTGAIVGRAATCANPRGIAFDGANERLLIACAGGELAIHDGDGLVEQRTVAPDLRDVIVGRDGAIFITRFRDAEVLTLDEELDVVDRELPRALDERRPSTAWRTVGTPDGGWVMVHQDTTLVAIPLLASFPYYTSSSGCDGPVASRVTMHTSGDRLLSSSRLSFAPMAVDIAIAPAGLRVAIANAGRDASAPTTFHGNDIYVVESRNLEPAEWGDCQWAPTVNVPDGQITAVAFASDEVLLAQSREPAALFAISFPPGAAIEEIPLTGVTRRDTGHDLFHRDVGTGIACASCHPEGGDDGRVWHFDPDDVERRTISLRGGIADTDPLHWAGELENFDALVDEVMQRRMGGLEQTRDRMGAMKRWVEAIPPYRAERGADRVVLAGRDVYVRLGCDRCHDDAALRAGATLEVEGEDLQAPSLRGVALHPRYMHDGRAGDLGEALDDMIARTVPTVALADDERDAVIAYLESL
ncbi:MAG TPA: hypothetical protein VG755_39055 [Nannocystaceae bacterium]|nr:hypothetical protein [Nannocystaceae bacterium]